MRRTPALQLHLEGCVVDDSFHGPRQTWNPRVLFESTWMSKSALEKVGFRARLVNSHRLSTRVQGPCFTRTVLDICTNERAASLWRSDGGDWRTMFTERCRWMVDATSACTEMMSAPALAKSGMRSSGSTIICRITPAPRPPLSLSRRKLSGEPLRHLTELMRSALAMREARG